MVANITSDTFGDSKVSDEVLIMESDESKTGEDMITNDDG